MDNNSDQQLQQLAIETQRHLPQSPQRQVALNRLVNGILHSNRLGHPQRGAWPSNLYEDFYTEALQKTLLQICQGVDYYNPQRPVMAWVNFHLKNQFIIVVNDYKKIGITSVPRSEKEHVICLPSLDELDQYMPVEESSDDQLLRQFLVDDPEHLLEAERLREHPSVTFQALALAMFDGQTCSEIATNLEISVQTLSSFINRRMHKLMPYFKKYLQA